MQQNRGVVKVFQHETKLRTAGGLTVTDITDEVQAAVGKSGVREGIACIYSPHTTCCVRVNELEATRHPDPWRPGAESERHGVVSFRSTSPASAPEQLSDRPSC